MLAEISGFIQKYSKQFVKIINLLEYIFLFLLYDWCSSKDRAERCTFCFETKNMNLYSERREEKWI